MLKKLFLSLLFIITALNATAPTQDNVAKLYVAMFDRAPDSDGLEYWVEESGLDLEGIAQSFFEQEETQERYPPGTTAEEFVTAVYDNLFDHKPDEKGLIYWAIELESESIPRSLFVLAVINGALGTDAATLENKMTFIELNEMVTNSEKILDIPTYDGSNQVVHPDILIKDSKFFLAITPFPNGDVEYENPSFYESSNGINFNVPDGLQNPIIPAPDYGYNDDPDIIFDERSNMYYMYYLETLEFYYQNVVLLKSIDGISWSKTDIIEYDFLAEEPFIVSPSVIVKNDTYTMFYVDISDWYYEDIPRSTFIIKYLKSIDGINWDKQKSNEININFPSGFIPWHVDIFEHNGMYYMLISGFDNLFWNKHHLYLAVSENLIDWNFISKPIIESSEEFHDSKGIYRSTGMINGNDLFVWFSFMTYQNTWHLGVKKMSIDEILK